MSDSDERQDLNEMFEGMESTLAEAERLGIPLLTGPASVQLVIRAEDAATPQEAVDMVTRQVMRFGFNHLMFRVTDIEAGHEYFVRAGEIHTRESLEAEVEERDGHE